MIDSIHLKVKIIIRNHGGTRNKKTRKESHKSNKDSWKVF